MPATSPPLSAQGALTRNNSRLLLLRANNSDGAIIVEVGKRFAIIGSVFAPRYYWGRRRAIIVDVGVGFGYY